MVAAIFFCSSMFGQLRPNDQTGINVFENPKTDTKFDGLKVSFGGAFTQGFQALKHSNEASVSLKYNPGLSINDLATQSKYDANLLVPIAPGFNQATANLMINAALADGVDLKMELYLSARHHQETWVKGGYIQFSKLPFIKLDLVDNIMKYTTFKMGHMEINYGDAHFRRTDNGNAIFNPFIENYIMDEFATEIGAEADINYNGIVGVLGVTTGEIKGDQAAATLGTGKDVAGVLDTVTDGSRRPAFLAKLGWDGKLLDNKLRIRATGSVYYTAGSTGVTLYGGDRGGSHYWGVMDNTLAGSSYTKDNIAFTSGRYNPNFGDKITSFMGNLLLTYQLTDKLSLESFTTLETSTGRGKTEATGERTASQVATDLIVRYGNFFLAGRYNVVNSQQYTSAITAKLATTATAAVTTPNPYGGSPIVLVPALPANPAYDAVAAGIYTINVNRIAVSAGWYITKNVMAKVEYSTQKYGNFLYNDIRHNGQFNGIVAEAVIGF